MARLDRDAFDSVGVVNVKYANVFVQAVSPIDDNWLFFLLFNEF